jgi:hypothetical protein
MLYSGAMSIYDTRSALWISHSSLSEYLECPRAYYLHHVYKDPQTKHKITLMSPPLSLGQAVHDLIEELSQIPTADRFTVPLPARFEKVWKNVSGKRGGFLDQETEDRYKARGLDMIEMIRQHPGPIAELAVKIKMDLPYYWLSKEDGIILCGKIDWLAYYPDTNSVAIIDFKTSMYEEKEGSLQLPIYVLLAQACQKRPVVGVSYWYLEREKEPTILPLPDVSKTTQTLITLAKEVGLNRKLGRLRCRQHGGCRACKPLEAIINHEAEFVYSNQRNQDVYILASNPSLSEDTSEIL